MAKIKHIAIVTMDPPKLAEFYRDVFDMKILHSSNNGATYLTDGYINLALLPNKAEGKPNGLNHFGFEIDDQAEIAAKMEAAGVKAPGQRPRNRPYAETRGCDPEGNNFDLSVHGFQQVEYAADREKANGVEPEKVDA